MCLSRTERETSVEGFVVGVLAREHRVRRKIADRLGTEVGEIDRLLAGRQPGLRDRQLLLAPLDGHGHRLLEWDGGDATHYCTMLTRVSYIWLAIVKILADA